MDLETESLRVLTVEDRLFLEIARKNGLLGDAEASRAIEEVAVRGLRLEAVLFRLRLLDQRQLKRVREALAASQVVRLDSLFGDLALEQGLVSADQLEAAFSEQRRQRFRVRVGGVLVQQGLLTAEQHRTLINAVIKRVKHEAQSGQGATAPRPTPRPGTERLDESDLPPPSDRVDRPKTEPLSMAKTRPFSLHETEGEPTEPLPLADQPKTEPLEFQYHTEPLAPPPSERDTRIMGIPTQPPQTGFSIPLHSADELPRTPSGYLAANLLHIEQAGGGEDFVPYEAQAEPTEDTLLASALRIGAYDPGSDERFLRNDLARSQGDTTEENFVLSRGELTDSEAARFELSGEGGRRLRQRAVHWAAGVGLTTLLIVLTGVLVSAVGNKRTLATVRTLLAQAQDGEPEARRELYLEAGEVLSQAGGLGVSDDERRRLRGLIRWGKLEAEALRDLGVSPQRAVQLLERRSGDVPPVAQDDYQALLRQARRESRLEAAREAEARGEFATAVAAYREAQASGDPQGLLRQELERVRERLRRDMDQAYKRAQASGDPDDERRFQEAAKLIQELFNEDPGAGQQLEQLRFRRAFAEAQAAIDAGRLTQAQELLAQAASLRPDDPTVRQEQLRLANLVDLGAELEQAAAAEQAGDLDRAQAAYRRALGMAGSSAERGRIRARLDRLEAQAGQRDLAAQRRDLQAETVAALRASRMPAALEQAEALVALVGEADATAAALLTLAQQAQGMVFVPGGPCLLGTPPGPGVDPLECPQHRVELAPYFIGRHEVTNAEYDAFVRTHGRRPPAHWRERGPDGAMTYPAGLARHPVVYVSWDDAVAYCRWRGVRLPSEAQWERAARGTQGQTWPWPEDARDVSAHIDARPDRRRRDWGTAEVGVHVDDTSPVGAKDMAGNVNEWTLSRLRPYADAPDEAKARLPREPRRVLKGGAYPYSIKEARAATREGAREDYTNREVGFRVALQLPDALVPLFE